MIDLILVRHGNTFGPEDKVVWAGARTDLPLVEAGTEQASKLGKNLAAAKFNPDHIITAPLIRTRQHADILANHIGFKSEIEILDALCEIDYGQWEGLSTEEIHALGGTQELADWNRSANWPQSPGWHPDEQTIKDATGTLLEKLATRADTGKTLLVTSNGILRFFARHCINPPSLSTLKVRTGHVCRMAYENKRWRQTDWNQAPDDFHYEPCE